MLVLKKELFNETSRLDEQVMRLRSFLNPLQTSKFVVTLEKFKDRPELNLFQLWGIKKMQADHLEGE